MPRLSTFQIFLTSTAAFFVFALLTHLGTPDGLAGVRSNISDVLTKASVKRIMARSEALWMKTVKQRHEVWEEFREMGFFPAVNSPTYFVTPYSVWDLVPASWNCPYEVERIGRMGDGGKWVCGMSRYERNSRPCIVYSFGVQNESSFEQEMLERTNCEIWGYDFSVEAFGPAITDEYSSRTHFLRAGISGKTDKAATPPYFSVQDLMQINGHSYIDILKIDVEFAEFDTMTSLISHTTSQSQAFPIGQMLMEIHLLGNEAGDAKPYTLGQFLDWWEALEASGIRPAWTEPNLLSVTLGIADRLPRLAEYTFVNVKDPKSVLW